MTGRESVLLRIIDQVSRHRDEIALSKDAQLWAILAGADAAIFGKPVTFTVDWPQGPPLNMTAEEFRAYAGEQAEKVRERQRGYFTESS